MNLNQGIGEFNVRTLLPMHRMKCDLLFVAVPLLLLLLQVEIKFISFHQ